MYKRENSVSQGCTSSYGEGLFTNSIVESELIGEIVNMETYQKSCLDEEVEDKRMKANITL